MSAAFAVVFGLRKGYPSMPYHPGFRARQETHTQAQNRRYDNVAAFSKRIAGKSSDWLSRNSEDSIRSSLVRSRVLNADGDMRKGTYEKWMRRNGFEGYFPESDEAYESMVEGGSP